MRLNRTLFLFVGLALFGALKPAHAWIFQEIPDKAVDVHYVVSIGTGVISTNTIIVDLSDTVNWPHKETGEINIDALRLNVDKVAASSATIKLGVVTFVSDSSGSVTWATIFASTRNVSNTTNASFANYLPASIRCHVNASTATEVLDGTTPYILSNDKTSRSTLYQNDVNLPTPSGSAKPGVGDIILQISSNEMVNFITVIIDLIYHSN